MFQAPGLPNILEKDMGTKKSPIPVGATAETVARNLSRLRSARGLSARALAAELQRMGGRITPDAITKIENVALPDRTHRRRVDVDDLMLLAAALDVSPSALLLPPTDSPDDRVEITGVGDIPADSAWDWMDGRRRLDRPSRDPSAADMLYHLYSRPPIRRNRELRANG